MTWRRIHAGVGLGAARVVVLHLAIAATVWLPAVHRPIVEGLAPWRGLLLAAAVTGLVLQAATGAAVLAHTGLRGGCRAASSPRLALAQRLSAIVLAGFLLFHVGAALLRDAAAAPASVVAAPSGIAWIDAAMLGVALAGGCAAALHIGIGVYTAPSIVRVPQLCGGPRLAIGLGAIIALAALAGVAGMAWHA